MSKKTPAILALAGLLAFFFAAYSSAAAINESDLLDVIIVLDASGSMRDSDPDRITIEAVKSLISMMPAKDCRVGIVSFNVKPKVRTQDSQGKDALIGLKNPSDADYIKQQLDRIEYMDDTGIGNALYKACEMLNSLAHINSRKAIILFTDGLDDLKGNNAIRQSIENEQNAISWAKENGCPVYCVGLDFENPDGSFSLGENGEGITKLNSISDATGGLARATTDIQKIEDLFIEMLADIFSIYYNDVEFSSTDSGSCIAKININKNVNEANIRIGSGEARSLRREDIELYGPDGKPALENGAGIRFDSDKVSSNIKLALPEAGEWTLVLNGTNGDGVKIGLLEHYYLGIKSEIIIPEGDAALYSGSTVTVKTYLTSKGEIITDGDVYDAVESAGALVTPASSPEASFKIDLKREGNSFTGSFIPEKSGKYEIEINLSTSSFYRTDSIAAECEDRPGDSLEMEKSFPDIELETGGQKSIEGVLSYVRREQSGAVHVGISQNDQNCAKIEYDSSSDTLTVEGLGAGETVAAITFSDEYGNTLRLSFTVRVSEPAVPEKKPAGPLAEPGWIPYASAAAAAIAITAYILYRNGRKEIKGNILLNAISLVYGETNAKIQAVYDEFGDIQEDFVLNTGIFRDKDDQNLACLLTEALERLDGSENPAQKSIREFFGSQAGQKMLKIAKTVRMEGSYKGSKGIWFVNSVKNKFVTINGKSSGRFNLDIDSGVEFKLSDQSSRAFLTVRLEYKTIIRHWTRTIVTPDF
ncbi:MAG: von Willebrand factor type A domain protein [Firmicutes bacterium ADurb.Bin182]|nr:MAG: von Willebrand factor type A domain protein [Firmicutes bacterium ADurb.Bin182]